ncbi:MAG TPA: anthranilate synthase component I family protein [Chitinophagales bacterium]|nr:anthranilate synthase component I family protein [Chitinophagales bacterium]
MRTFYPFPVANIETFKLQLLEISNAVKHFCYLDSNNYPNYPYSTFGSLFAIDAVDVISVNTNCLEQFEKFQQQHQDWFFGFLNYDLKNEIEPTLKSNNIDNIQNPLLHFFVPKYLVKIENEKVEIGVLSKSEREGESFLADFKFLINNQMQKSQVSNLKSQILQRISKQDYINTIQKIKQHIQLGNIYEMNFCQEFYAENAEINPVAVFKKLNEISKAPFTSFFKNEQNYLLCASPERFLKRQNNTLISQPIKGTRKRNKDKKEDNLLKQQLFFDEKERSENVMIVDLVRNDFSKIAIKNSVEVDELFGIYSFEQVHQMISTVSCKIENSLSFSDIIKAVFPMGSMTGAPKIAAMQLIEKYEPTKRGLFSGAVGYITPKGNFDFNVVIRSILYNSTNNYISIQTGSAITIDCNAEKEYEECLLKAKAMLEALS